MALIQFVFKNESVQDMSMNTKTILFRLIRHDDVQTTPILCSGSMSNDRLSFQIKSGSITFEQLFYKFVYSDSSVNIDEFTITGVIDEDFAMYSLSMASVFSISYL